MAAEERIGAVRSFNRFITRRFGVLERGFLGTNHSLTEARLVYELAQAPAIETSRLREAVGIDSGYLSRLLSRLEKAALVSRSRSPQDARRRLVSLTEEGRELWRTLDARSSEQAGALLDSLPEGDQRTLVGAMETVRRLTGGASGDRTVVLRAPAPGDLGWIVERHGTLYSHEYGWDERFEALVAEVVADYAARADRRRNAAWIAEVDGRRAGSILLVEDASGAARLRLLLVEPSARGLGLGRRLVDEAIRFARRAGYEEVVLWTNDVLDSARPIYEAAGFHLVAEEPHSRFGPEAVGQDWALALGV
jgi:DNA-binding MarR family transcriptional regulator/GNAT superfamily N-acetyltransferase